MEQNKFFTVKTLLIIIIICGILGAVDASYLTYMAYRELPLPCTFAIFDGCNDVARSPYSKMFGIPLYLFGVVYYVLVILLSGGYLALGRELLKKLILPLTLIGFLFSVYFIYVQAFLIGKLCMYCVFSALMSTVLFISSIFLKSPQE